MAKPRTAAVLVAAAVIAAVAWRALHSKRESMTASAAALKGVPYRLIADRAAGVNRPPPAFRGSEWQPIASGRAPQACPRPRLPGHLPPCDHAPTNNGWFSMRRDGAACQPHSAFHRGGGAASDGTEKEGFEVWEERANFVAHTDGRTPRLLGVPYRSTDVLF